MKKEELEKRAEEIIKKRKDHSGIDYYYISEIIPMMIEFAQWFASQDKKI